MSATLESDQYRALFLAHTPMIDLRAPAEFQRGAFPSAASLPLLTDDERAQVGICFKREGQAAAIELGHTLVAGSQREQRMQAWLAFAERHPQGCLYCWRGGLRSKTVQQWLAEAGRDYPRVVGGYKALRRFLLEELEHSVANADFILVSGKTGTGKTRVIERLSRTVDLEALANHRGSSFGQLPDGQPSQIDFENALSIALMRLLDLHTNAHRAPIFLEDEGRLVGRVALPENLRLKMKSTPMVVVEESLASRVEVVLQDYIIDLGERYALRYGEDGPRLHSEKMLADLGRIKKRLGGARYQEVAALMRNAFEVSLERGEFDAHRPWIQYLLSQYYDPMYQYQLDQRSGEQRYCGDRSTVLAWAQEQIAHAS